MPSRKSRKTIFCRRESIGTREQIFGLSFVAGCLVQRHTDKKAIPTNEKRALIDHFSLGVLMVFQEK